MINRLRDILDLLLDHFWTFFDHASFFCHNHWRFAAGLLIAMTALAISLGGRVLGWVSVGLGIVMMFWDMLDRYFESRRLKNDVLIETDASVDRVLGAVVLPEGFEHWQFAGGIAVVSVEVNRMLGECALPIRAKPHPYVLPRILRPYLLKVINERKPSFNEAKVRLATDLTPQSFGGEELLVIQKTDYFKGRLTNESIHRRFMERTASGELVPAYRMLGLLVDCDGLVPLSRSSLSNHIGVTSLLITADNHLVLQLQGSANLIDPRYLALGGSGSVDWDDYLREFELAGENNGDPTLGGLIIHAVEREIREETCAPQNGMKTILVGYARYLHRGGKPEFFGITVTSSKFCELRVRPAEKSKFVDELMFLSFGGGQRSLTEKISDLVAAETLDGRPISFSMHVGLRMAALWLVENSDGLELLRARLTTGP